MDEEGQLRSMIYDKCNVHDFQIVCFPFMKNNITYLCLRDVCIPIDTMF